MNTTMTFEIQNDLLEIERVHQMLDAFSDSNQLSGSVAMKIKLAVEELLNNVISYGYADEQPHTILLNVSLEGTVITIRITHDGDPFNPQDAPPPPENGNLETMRIGGLGIFLVKEMMDSLDYEQVGTNNIIIVKKYIS